VKMVTLEITEVSQTALEALVARDWVAEARADGMFTRQYTVKIKPVDPDNVAAVLAIAAIPFKPGPPVGSRA
jgi:hypothetical protein